MYDYETEKPKLFTEEGVELLRTVERTVRRHLALSGAVRAQEALEDARGGDDWLRIACLDYLAECGVIRQFGATEAVATQHRVYVAGPRYG